MILYFLLIAQAPAFTLKDLDKNNISLDSLLLKSEVVVIDFWATWCKGCIRELDVWKELSNELEDVTFVAITEDGPRTQRQVPIMVKSRGWKFLVLYDDDRKVMKLFQVRALPHTFIIGKGREILYQHIGYDEKDKDLLRNELLSILKAVPAQKGAGESGESKEPD